MLAQPRLRDDQPMRVVAQMTLERLKAELQTAGKVVLYI
jgi:hypothetical protein